MSQELKKGTCLNCDKQACFNLPDAKPAIYCSTHKLYGMINFRASKCKFDSCQKRPSFGLVNCKPLWCFKHKTEEMINLKCKTCIHPNCTKQPSFDLEKSTFL